MVVSKIRIVMMKTEQIIEMCQKLASKYKHPHMREDLISEGILAVYERLAKEPEDYPASLYRRANKAMHDYINIRSKAVYIPTSRSATETSLGKEYNGQNYSEVGKKALEEALFSTVVSFDEEFMTSVEDCSEEYERKDYIDKALKLLTKKERGIIEMRYFEDMTQQEICDFYGVSQKSISMWEKSALEKMSKL